MGLSLFEGEDAFNRLVARLMRSMCITHVHPSVFLRIFSMLMFGVACSMSGGAIGGHAYHWRNVL